MDDFEESTSGASDSRHWRTALEKRGCDEETIRELSTAGQALVATVNAYATRQQTGTNEYLASSSTSSYTNSLIGQLYNYAGGSVAGLGTPEKGGNGIVSSLFEVSAGDFGEYLARNEEALSRFARARENGKEGGKEERRRSWQQGEGLVESMRSVPEMYFKETFDLANPETYNKTLRGPAGHNEASVMDEGEAVWMEAVGQLSHYVDNVEINLMREIQARAHQFFEAMDIIQKLQRCTSQACLSVSITRRGLNQNKKATASSVANMKRLQEEKEALEAVLRLATDLDTVCHANSTLQMLLPTRDYASILDVTKTLQTALEANSEVRALRCFKGSESKISEVKTELVEEMNEGFVKLALKAGRPLLQEDGERVTGGRDDAQGSSPRHRPLVDSMLPLVLSLHRTGSLGDAIKVYFTRLEHNMKTSMPKVVTHLVETASSEAGRHPGTLGSEAAEKDENGDNDEDDRPEAREGGDLLRNQLVELPLESFLRMQEKMVSLVREWVSQSLNDVRGILELILKESFFVYSQGFESMADFLEETFAGYWAKIFSMRYPAHQTYKLQEYLKLIEATRALLGEDTSKGASRYNVVRNVLNSQSKSYLDVLHKYCKTKLVSALQHDQWKVSPVSRHIQDLVGWLSETTTSFGEDGSPVLAQTETRRKSDVIECVVLEGGKFHLVPSLVVFVQTVSDLISYSHKVPQLTTEVTHRLIELFKIYNALSCSLILGAGAMDKAGLKSISAKHLAATAQAISFIKRVLPLVKANLMSKLVPLHKNILAPQFRSLGKDLGEHHGRLEAKLVKIMQDRLSANLGVLASMSKTWDEQWSTAEDGSVEYKPSQFARAVSKQLDVLKSALSFLLEEELESIFGQICEIYTANITSHFKDLEPGGDHWRGQLRADASAILETLNDLPVVEKDTSVLESFVATIV
ncbi:vacuolar protein sorting-associated protein [Chloropicon primus]|uniref:Vacuolar protein sorting-associated protein 54 n=3 Tax=Chloropicon primus TaxID=1764295 RepID=A0A5B8MXS8_9CHLO|nr:vacuolar protein sorting-associated protein [Chloropicon primus]UPR04356.1 vacuolar protein sorting-associated protein [Chloropicon primus]|eukprot:QDZ25151.1 vacuolar protein sorting-associated protein [Chloropicon primus]